MKVLALALTQKGTLLRLQGKFKNIWTYYFTFELKVKTMKLLNVSNQQAVLETVLLNSK